MASFLWVYLSSFNFIQMISFHDGFMLYCAGKGFWCHCIVNEKVGQSCFQNFHLHHSHLAKSGSESKHTLKPSLSQCTPLCVSARWSYVYLMCSSLRALGQLMAQQSSFTVGVQLAAPETCWPAEQTVCEMSHISALWLKQLHQTSQMPKRTCTIKTINLG